MAAKKFLRFVNGVFTEIFGVQTSAGASNAGDIPALDDSGRLDQSLMPIGIGADTKIIPASEALAAGAYVNVWNSSGAKARNADATVAGKRAHGFVLAAVASGANATVYFEGTNTGHSGLTPGAEIYLQTTAGQGAATIPSASGNVVQRLGIAASATEVSFEAAEPVTLA